MPRYLFNIMNDVKTSKELPHLEAARGEAQKDIVDIVGSHFHTLGSDWSKYSIEICDLNGELLLVVPFSRN